MRSTSSGLSTYYYYSFSFFWIIFYPFPIIKLSPFYLITSPVPTCLVHNCEISWRLFYFHLLSPLSQDQIPFDPHHCYDGVMSRGLWEFDHKIDTEGIPPCIQNGERLKLANRRMLPRFRLEAEVISTHILADVPRHLGPPVVLEH